MVIDSLSSPCLNFTVAFGNSESFCIHDFLSSHLTHFSFEPKWDRTGFNNLTMCVKKMVKDKEVNEEEKSVEEREKSELVNGLNALIADLKEEEELIPQNAADLQKKRAKGLEKKGRWQLRVMGWRIEKEEMERILESLIEEKSSSDKSLRWRGRMTV